MEQFKMVALKEFLYKIADDALIIGHRNSEWTGLGPVLEEDIAFSSMAQDKIGHAWNIYKILHNDLGEADPDQLAFNRVEKDFKCCHLVEYPIGKYDFSLMRHFLFDHAEYLRYGLLQSSSNEALASLATIFKSEIKYHIMHADTWVKQLANGTEESKARMQSALNECWPLALGIFEEDDFEKQLQESAIFVGEAALKEAWLEKIGSQLESYGLKIPSSAEPILGGRKGYHTEHLQPLLNEMSEVFQIDTEADW